MARILLAEPDRQVRVLVAGILTDFGHVVEQCSGAAEAQTLASQEPFDIIATDLVLAGSAGDPLRRHAVALRIPTVTLTGRRVRPSGQPDDALAALHEKPFRFDDFRELLDSVATHCREPRAAAA